MHVSKAMATALVGLGLTLGQSIVPACADEPLPPIYDTYGYNPPSEPAWSYSWTGYYAGLQVQNTSMKWAGTLDGGTPESLNWSGSGTSIGAHVGYQQQFGQLVAGAELSYVPVHASASQASAAQAGLNVSANASNLYLANAKLGYAYGRYLGFVKGGYATAALAAGTDGNYLSSASSRNSGWTTGIGLEYALTRRIILGAEYTYVQLGSSSYTLTDGTNSSTLAGSGLELRSFGLRIDYKFN